MTEPSRESDRPTDDGGRSTDRDDPGSDRDSGADSAPDTSRVSRPSSARSHSRADAAAGRSWRSRRRIPIAGTALLVFLGVPLALRSVDLEAVVAAVSSADPALLALAVVAYVLSWPVRGRRYDDVLGAMGSRQGVGFLTALVWCSQTANLVVPARAGDAVRAVALSTRRDVPYARGFASLAVERLFDLLAIAALAGVATAWLVLAGGVGALEVAPGGGEAADVRQLALAASGVGVLAVLAAVTVVLAARTSPRWAERLRSRLAATPRLRTVVAALERFAGDVAVVARDPAAVLVVGAGSLVVWALDVLTAMAVLAALDVGLAPGRLLVVATLAVSVGNLAKVLPLTQGGIGLYEAAFTAVVVAVSPIGASTALAAAIVDHALKNAVTLVGGAFAALALGLSPFGTTATDEGREPTDRQPF